MIPEKGSRWRLNALAPAAVAEVIVEHVDYRYDPPAVCVVHVLGRDDGQSELWPPSIFDDTGMVTLL